MKRKGKIAPDRGNMGPNGRRGLKDLRNRKISISKRLKERQLEVPGGAKPHRALRMGYRRECVLYS